MQPTADNRLTRLVGALLDVTRIGAGKFALDLGEVDLAILVEDVVSRMCEDLERAGCQVDMRLVSVVGRWDRLRLDQVITNLLTNALKYATGRPIAITVEERSGSAHLTVRDHGLGIDPIVLPRLFERFERVTPSRQFGGLGLGLFICRRIVTEHGGKIIAKSEQGKGSEFIVELPLTGPK